jgi:uncharacterized membrane protein YphA (DoxX/SURF4 family)
MSLPTSRTYGYWLAVVRILTGAIWLIHAVPKFRASSAFLPPTGGFGTYLQQGIAKTTGPYHDFLVNVVQPNAAVFADLVRFGELLVGISLVLGLLSRLGGFFGIVLTLNYIAARGGLHTVKEWGSLDAALALLCAISLVLPTGRVAGFGMFVARRPAQKAPVTAEFVPERPMEGPHAPP